jgi:hypothetical protein
MNKAKRRVWPMSPWIVAAFGSALLLGGPGCSGLPGLRSIAPDRQSVLGFWDKAAVGSPTPGADHYAQSVHGAGGPGNPDTKGTDRALLAAATPIDPLEEGASPEADSTQQASKQTGTAPSSLTSPRGQRTYVTLGRPEPLPALALDAQSPKLAGTARSSSWRSEESTKRSSTAEPAPMDDSGVLALASSKPATETPDPSRGREGRAVLASAEAKLRSLTTYKLKVSRVERVGGQLQPAEELVLSVRTEPKAVRLEWSDGPSKGREVIYSSSLDPRMIFVHMANSAIPIPTMKIPIDSPLVLKNSRHSIKEAGLDTVVENLRRAEEHADDSGKHDQLEYHGLQKPPGSEKACHEFLIRSVSGELWKIYLDRQSKLPTMVIGEDQSGTLIERYVYREISPDPADLAAAEAFDPEKRWGDSKGLLSRLARAATGAETPANSQSRTR